ncbi:type I restriction endonuclease subunit R [Aeromonas rivipollensis]|uniref:type I restriction endonuclease subunit R n=1 Tax=Aeromonas rivipollensis TaxID=948519 RepID=UPI0038CFC275
MITEAQLEKQCINWFIELGYQYKNGYDIAPDGDTPERENYQQVILHRSLLSMLARLNQGVPSEVLSDAAKTLTTPTTPVLIKNNQAFHQYCIEGVPVEYSLQEAGQRVTKYTHLRVIDFENPANNEFIVVNQFTITGSKGNRRPDILVFINGLPIGVVELKNPADEHADIWNAYNQIQTYREEVVDLFAFNQALVISDGWTARVGSLTANKERFLPWKTINSEDDKPLLEFQLETMVRGFFKPELLLDYLRYFVLFENNGDKVIKKIAGYHQFHAVRAAVHATVIAAEPSTAQLIAEPPANHASKVVPGSKKAGVIWHTQGSGKSISMVCYASKLLQQPAMNNPTLVVVTDRNDLDGQLFNTFTMAQQTLKQIPLQADDRDSLRELLRARQSGGIIFTTVQKFSLLGGENAHPCLSERTNIVVVSDEAHRSQYGNKARLVDVKDEQGVVIDQRYVYGYSKYLRDALPNATFIGFTGTPIEQDDKDTRGVFGDYVSIYDIQDAVDDGATVPIYYESRLARLDINREEIEALNDQVEEEIGEDEETQAREKIKSQWSALEKLVGAKPRIEQVAKDLIEHFTTRCETFPGKAMIVAMSREICVDLYDAIVALKPEWHSDDPAKGAIKIVMTGSAADKAKMQPHIYDKKTKRLFEKRFKDVNDELQLVIVRDMWLTGFDAPCCHSMYIDKPMKGHNLMQAIARVNRVFKDKPGGLVVDYIGIANELKNALKAYTNSRGKGKPTVDTAESFSIFIEKVDVIRGMFATPVDGEVFNYRPDFETRPLQLLPGAVNHISGLCQRNSKGEQVRDGKRRFLDVMAAMMKAFSLCSTLDEVNGYRHEIAFYGAIKTAFLKHSTVDKKRSDELRNSALRQILNNAIVADGVDDIFKTVGLDKPNIGLLSEEFLEDVKHMKERNLAVELLEKLLRDEVKARMKNDVVQEKKYSERIMSTLQKYHNRSIETAQVIEELIQWAKEMQADSDMMDKLNLSPDEIAFYRALVTNETSVRTLGDDNLRQLAIELTHQLRQSATVDWQKRESVRARMRNLVRRLLRRWRYPPDAAEDTIRLILEQAEVLADTWTM